MEIITVITAFIASLSAGKLAAIATLVVYFIGLFSKSKAYGSVRTTIGKVFFGFGDAASNFATSKVGKVIWAPIEAVLTDYILFAVEQFAAGLRADNVEKLEAQVDRLKGVGSTFRREAIEGKLDILKDPNDRRLLDRLNQFNSASAENKLKG